MSENNSRYALGSLVYSAGDVLLTNILTRLNVNPKFLNTQLEKRPILKEYYTMVKNRPSYIKADIHFPNTPSNFVLTSAVLIIIYFLSIIIWAFFYPYDVKTYFWIFLSVSITLYTFIILLGCVGKCRLTSFQN